MTVLPESIQDAASKIRAGEITSVELVTASLAGADAVGDTLGTWITRFPEPALAAAQRADDELSTGTDRGPLHGIPLGIKDIIATDEGPTTAQSQVLPPSWGDQGDGPVIGRLRDAGAVVIGKTTTMEFAIGRPDFDLPFPIPRNPWDPERWTGGSSSGTANGIASGQILGGLGTDTGGSVRLPAAYCGISGHKPTFGLVPKSGCVPLGMSYDHIGPMAHSAWDCAALLSVMAGPDASDRTSVASNSPTDYCAGLRTELDGVTVGTVTNASVRDSSSPSMLAAFDAALDSLRAAGATVVDFEVPLYDELALGDFLALEAEAFAWHRDLLAERWNDYGRPTRLTIVQGALISAGDLVQIERVRQVGRRRILDAMSERGVGLLASPTTGYPATPFTGADPRATSMAAIHTPAWNATGFPALSVPMGPETDGLPCGLQLIGLPFADDLVLSAGHAYQQQTQWHKAIPPVSAR